MRSCARACMYACVYIARVCVCTYIAYVISACTLTHTGTRGGFIRALRSAVFRARLLLLPLVPSLLLFLFHEFFQRSRQSMRYDRKVRRIAQLARSRRRDVAAETSSPKERGDAPHRTAPHRAAPRRVAPRRGGAILMQRAEAGSLILSTPAM
jgi:hypothetical protein